MIRRAITLAAITVAVVVAHPATALAWPSMQGG
jgi:hypothetical protein